MDTGEGAPFGFEVRFDWHGDGEWEFCLPHSCNQWTIAIGSDKAEVMAEVERFMDECRDKLAEMRRNRP